MKLSKFLILIFLITFFSLFYVWQQTEIFRLAYSGQKSADQFQELLDKNSFLRYNLKKNTSLVSIGNKMTDFCEFQMPDSYRLVKLSVPKESLSVVHNRLPRENIFARLFGIKREAEAKTINR